MRHVELQFKNDGYVLIVKGFVRHNGEFVFKATEELRLVERLAEVLMEKRVEIVEK